MKLNFAENIRRLRRERGFTQEQLAQKLCVSDQIVSRWETSVTYPDIELLPAISEFFGVTIDELLGAEKGDNGRAPQAVYERLTAAFGTNEYKSLCAQAHRDYPKDMELLCRLIDASQDDNDLEGLRRYIEELLSSCDIAAYRERAVMKMAYAETDDKRLETFLDKYTTKEDCRRDMIMEHVYHRRQDWEKYNAIQQKNAIHDVTNLLNRLNIGGPPRWDPADSLWSVETQLKVINALVGYSGDNLVLGDGEIDLWANWRAYCGIRRACYFSAFGCVDLSLNALEEAVGFYERIFSLPEKTVLSYRCPAFGGVEACLDISYTKYYVPGKTERMIVYRMRRKDGCIVWSISPGRALYPMTAPKGWEWFDNVRSEPRYKACVERLRSLMKTAPDEPDK